MKRPFEIVLLGNMVDIRLIIKNFTAHQKFAHKSQARLCEQSDDETFLRSHNAFYLPIIIYKQLPGKRSLLGKTSPIPFSSELWQRRCWKLFLASDRRRRCEIMQTHSTRRKAQQQSTLMSYFIYIARYIEAKGPQPCAFRGISPYFPSAAASHFCATFPCTYI